MAITATRAITDAIAAPSMPQPNLRISSMSSNTLTIAAPIVTYMARRASPTDLSTAVDAMPIAKNGRVGMRMTR